MLPVLAGCEPKQSNRTRNSSLTGRNETGKKVLNVQQLEEAIARVLETGSALSSEMRTRLRRLLEIDRGLGRIKRSTDAERANFAFYSSDAPGRGVEIRFSEYEAFALLVGLGPMQRGWPQGFAVGALRGLRPELESQHVRF